MVWMSWTLSWRNEYNVRVSVGMPSLFDVCECDCVCVSDRAVHGWLFIKLHKLNFHAHLI